MENSIDNREKINEQNNLLEVDCSFLDTLVGMDINGQITWLRGNQEAIRDNYLACVEKFHIVNFVEYRTIVENFWGKGVTPVYTDIPLQEFLDLPCNYEEFAVFDCDTTHKVSYTMKRSVSSISSCYSIPFFHSLKANHPELVTTPPSTMLRFTKGKVDGYIVILFYIPNLTIGYFDYSHYPKITLAMKSESNLSTENLKNRFLDMDDNFRIVECAI